MRIELRHGVAIVGFVLIIVALYLMLYYDVPDDMETINVWTSTALLVIGVIGIAAGLLLKKKHLSFP
jgi:hypothetical protein